MSAIATLDGKQYNYLRSKLHILVNKVNTRLTISGFKVCLPRRSVTRNTSYAYDRKAKCYFNRFLFQLLSPWLFPSNCDYMFGLDESGGNEPFMYIHTVLQVAITTLEGRSWAYPFIKIPLTDTHPAYERLATPSGSTFPSLFEQWCGFFYVP